MVSGFEKCRERTDPKRGAESCVESEVVFGFGAGDVTSGVVETTAGNQIRLGSGSGKSEYEIEQRSHDTWVRGARAGCWSSAKLESVVDPIEPYAEREFRHTDRQNDKAVVAWLLGIAQLADWDGGASTYAQSIGSLGETRARQGRQSKEGNQYYSEVLLHDGASGVAESLAG